MTLSRLRATFAALAAAAALAVAGCSTTTTGSGIGPVYTSISGLAAAMVHANAELTSAQGTLALSSGPVTETGTFTEKLAAGQVQALEARYSVTAQGATTPLHMIIINNTVYVDTAAGDRPWVRATPDNPNPVIAGLATDVPATLEQSSVTEYVALLSAAKDLTMVGEATVDGVSCLHYSVVVDPASAAQTLPGSQGEQMQQAADAGVDAIPLDLWVDAAGRIHEVADKVTVGATTATVQLRENHFNDPVSIKAPPQSQIGPG